MQTVRYPKVNGRWLRWQYIAYFFRLLYGKQRPVNLDQSSWSPPSVCVQPQLDGMASFHETRACFLSLARRKVRLCSVNHRPGYWSSLPCDWPSTAWAYSEQETENGPWWFHYSKELPYLVPVSTSLGRSPAKARVEATISMWNSLSRTTNHFTGLSYMSSLMHNGIQFGGPCDSNT